MAVNQQFNDLIQIKNDKGVDVSIANAYASLDAVTGGFSIGLSVYDKDLLAANIDLVKERFAAFEAEFKEIAVIKGFAVG